MGLSAKDIKVLLNIKSTQFDDYIEAMLPVVIAWAEAYCSSELVARDVNGVIIETQEGYTLNDMGLAILFAKIIEFYLTKTDVTYEAIGRVTHNFATDLPKAIYTALIPYKKGRIAFL